MASEAVVAGPGQNAANTATRMPVFPVTATNYGWPNSVTHTTGYLCPDLLRYEQIGEADGWRGRVVRAFFWLMRAWPT